jgi:hypothetical protein
LKLIALSGPAYRRRLIVKPSSWLKRLPCTIGGQYCCIPRQCKREAAPVAERQATPSRYGGKMPRFDCLFTGKWRDLDTGIWPLDSS